MPNLSFLFFFLERRMNKRKFNSIKTASTVSHANQMQQMKINFLFKCDTVMF